MMPGQEPYTPAELERLYRMIDEACDDDPGEAGEIEIAALYRDEPLEGGSG